MADIDVATSFIIGSSCHNYLTHAHEAFYAYREKDNEWSWSWMDPEAEKGVF